MTVKNAKKMIPRMVMRYARAKDLFSLSGLSYYAALIVVSGAVSLLLGSDVVVVILATAAALISKFLAWDRLDNGIYAPVDSFLVVFLGTFGVVLAALAARLLWRSRPLFKERYSALGLQFLLIFGIAATAITIFTGFSKID